MASYFSVEIIGINEGLNSKKFVKLSGQLFTLNSFQVVKLATNCFSFFETMEFNDVTLIVSMVNIFTADHVLSMGTYRFKTVGC